MLTVQRRRKIAEDHLKAQEEYYTIVKDQEELGAASGVEVDRAKSNLDTTRADIPVLDEQVRQIKNRLAVLLGQNPGALDGVLEGDRNAPIPPARIAVGVPAQVLRRRPDVRAAERVLAAETARVGVAVVELYPKFSLVGTVGLESASSGDLFQRSSGIFGFGPQVQWNLFDEGRVRQQIEIQNAVQEQALIHYEQSVLIALEDVENAITAYIQEQLRRKSLESAADSASSAAALALTQYESGETAFLSVLDAQMARLSAQDSLAVCEGQVVANLIRLYKALGGGWKPEAPGP